MTATDEQIKRVRGMRTQLIADNEALAAVLAELTELRDKLDLCEHENCDLSAKVDGYEKELATLREENARLKSQRQ